MIWLASDTTRWFLSSPSKLSRRFEKMHSVPWLRFIRVFALAFLDQYKVTKYIGGGHSSVTWYTYFGLGCFIYKTPSISTQPDGWRTEPDGRGQR